MATENHQIFRQVYNVREDSNLLSEMVRVTCVLFRRGVVAAAYDASGSLLSVHYAAYATDRPIWELDFFEQLFHQEPLLTNSSIITKVFFLTETNLVVPDEFNEPNEVKYWLRSIYFNELSDVVLQYPLKEDLAIYYYSIPHHIMELAKINSNNALFAPIPAYQFTGNYTRGVKFHCALTADQACITLCHYGSLLWHKVLDYASAEDIVYNVRLVCGEHKINPDKVTLSCNAFGSAEFSTIQQLAQYFAGGTTGEGAQLAAFWSPVISLFKQLEACA